MATVYWRRLGGGVATHLLSALKRKGVAEAANQVLAFRPESLAATLFLFIYRMPPPEESHLIPVSSTD